jgi:hypothetical protein
MEKRLHPIATPSRRSASTSLQGRFRTGYGRVGCRAVVGQLSCYGFLSVATQLRPIESNGRSRAATGSLERNRHVMVWRVDDQLFDQAPKLAGLSADVPAIASRVKLIVARLRPYTVEEKSSIVG